MVGKHQHLNDIKIPKNPLDSSNFSLDVYHCFVLEKDHEYHSNFSAHEVKGNVFFLPIRTMLDPHEHFDIKLIKSTLD